MARKEGTSAWPWCSAAAHWFIYSSVTSLSDCRALETQTGCFPLLVPATVGKCCDFPLGKSFSARVTIPLGPSTSTQRSRICSLPAWSRQAGATGATGATGAPRLCQQLHPRKPLARLPRLGVAITLVPLPAVGWFGVGQLMSCVPAPLGTHGTAVTGCCAPSGLPTADVDLC